MTRLIFIIAILVFALCSVVPRTSGQVNVTQKNNNASRDGQYIDPAFTSGNGAKLVRDANFDGTIVGNTTLTRPSSLRDRATAEETGGLSGRPLFKLSTRMLAETFVRAEGAFPLIGVGGIDSGPAAIAKIRAGATLVQLYTGLVYRGLGLLHEIKADLIAAVKRGRRESLQSMVGVDAAEMTAENWPV